MSLPLAESGVTVDQDNLKYEQPDELKGFPLILNG